MRIGSWELTGFIYVDSSIDFWSGCSLFRLPVACVEEKLFVWDIWIPFLGWRIQLTKPRYWIGRTTESTANSITQEVKR